MRIINLIIGLFILLTSISCVSTVKTNKADKSSYNEDLSAYLPPDPLDTVIVLEAEPNLVAMDSTLIITSRLDSALAVVNTYNVNRTRYIEGLSIQLYSGNDRSRAKEVQLKAFRHFPESNPKIIFDQPNYKVRMENFYSQLEAYPMYESVQSKFSKAILVPIRIPISRK